MLAQVEANHEAFSQTVAIIVAWVGVLLAFVVGTVLVRLGKRPRLSRILFGLCILLAIASIILTASERALEGTLRGVRALFNWGSVLVVVGVIVGAVGYNAVLRWCVRGSIGTVRKKQWQERLLDFLAGHRRFKVIRRFPAYCRSCEQMLGRAAKEVGSWVSDDRARTMRTVQTPAELPATGHDGDEGLEAYLRYIACTYSTIMLTNWKYNRLVYLPTDQDDKFSQAFARSVEFARGYAVECCFGPYANREKRRIVVPDHYRYRTVLPEGAQVHLGEVRIGYTSSMQRLLDVVSRLDLHMPPGHEFSIAFMQEDIADESGQPGFVGCVRVCEPRRPGRRHRDEINGEVKQALAEIFESEWEGIGRAMVNLTDLVVRRVLDASRSREGTAECLRRFSEGASSQTLGDDWLNAGFDALFIRELVAHAVLALYDNEGNLPRSAGLEHWVELAISSVPKKLGVAVARDSAIEEIQKLVSAH